MLAPPVWTEAELEAQRRIAIDAFREERIRAPLAAYLAVFDQRRAHFEELIDGVLAAPDPAAIDDDTIARVLGSEALLEAFRYLAAPPISSDDLMVLAEADSLSPRALLEDPTRARRVFGTVLQAIDRRRFPWAFLRAPAAEERAAAVTASTALLATRRTETDRRSEGKTAQEAAVFAALAGVGVLREPARTIRTLDEAPSPGRCCGESMLGGRKADVVVRLHDRRVLALECKVSNSATNSI